MNIELLREYCISKPAVTEEFPFDKDTLVFKVLGKMFALSSLKGWEAGIASVNLKCDPERAVQLREEHEEIIEGWHMSKIHWNTIYIDRLNPKLTKELIDHSYDLVVSKFTKKLKAELDALS